MNGRPPVPSAPAAGAVLRRPPPAASAAARAEVVYKSVGGEDLRVDVFRPDGDAPASAGTAAAGRPALALFHGGGWVYGDKAECAAIAARYARRGLVCCAFAYRLSLQADGSYPRPGVSPLESVQDARSALRWMRTHARDLGLDPARIAVAGQSCGGQLALCTALAEGVDEPGEDPAISPAPQAVILYSACVNTLEVWVDNLLQERRGRIWEISPHHRARPGMPPVLAFHGGADATVPLHTVHFFQRRMRELGNAFTLVALEGRTHYLGGPRDGPYAGYVDEAILERTDAFLHAHGFLP